MQVLTYISNVRRQKFHVPVDLWPVRKCCLFSFCVHRLSNCEHTGRPPGPYWATSTELAGAREYAGCLDVQSPEKRVLSPEGLAAG